MKDTSTRDPLAQDSLDESRHETATKEPHLDIAAVHEVALWIAQNLASAGVGVALGAYIEDFRRRRGRRETEDLRERVYRELKRVKRKPQVADADLRNRVDRLFDKND